MSIYQKYYLLKTSSNGKKLVIVWKSEGSEWTKLISHVSKSNTE